MLKLLEEGRELNFLLAMLSSSQQSNYNSTLQTNHSNNSDETMNNSDNDTVTTSSSRNSVFSMTNRNSADDEWQMNYIINKRDGLYFRNILLKTIL